MRQILVGLVTLAVLVACTAEEVDLNDAVVVAGDISVGSPPPATTPAPTAAASTTAPTSPPQTPVNDGLFPTVVDATATATAAGGSTWRFDVTLLSEYDSPARYADAWRVLDADDNELGIRVLTHDHAGEQPFTRSTSVDVPDDVTAVFIEGRDQANGWSGERFEVTIARP